MKLIDGGRCDEGVVVEAAVALADEIHRWRRERSRFLTGRRARAMPLAKDTDSSFVYLARTP
jgi:hypothetical protein